MATSVEWHGDDFFDDTKKALGDNLEAAAIYLVGKVKDNLNRDQPYKKSTSTAIIRREGGKTTHKKRRQRQLKGVYYYGLAESAPGEFPKKLTGHLQRSITYAMSKDRQQAFVGTGLDYGLFLEVGTTKMAARPYLLPTLAAERDAISNIVATGKK
jgi:hypothetical protein